MGHSYSTEPEPEVSMETPSSISSSSSPTTTPTSKTSESEKRSTTSEESDQLLNVTTAVQMLNERLEKELNSVYDLLLQSAEVARQQSQVVMNMQIEIEALRAEVQKRPRPPRVGIC